MIIKTRGQDNDGHEFFVYFRLIGIEGIGRSKILKSYFSAIAIFDFIRIKPEG